MSLVAHYKMDDNEANTIVLDSWAGANNGTSLTLCRVRKRVSPPASPDHCFDYSLLLLSQLYF